MIKEYTKVVKAKAKADSMWTEDDQVSFKEEAKTAQSRRENNPTIMDQLFGGAIHGVEQATSSSTSTARTRTLSYLCSGGRL